MDRILEHLDKRLDELEVRKKHAKEFMTDKFQLNGELIDIVSRQAEILELKLFLYDEKLDESNDA